MQKECFICFNKFDISQVIFLSCGNDHYLCHTCFNSNILIKSTCPFCTKEIDLNEIIIEKFWKIMISAERGTFILCKNRKEQIIILKKLRRRLENMNCYSIISRPTNEVEIDYKLTSDTFNTFIATSEESSSGIVSFAAQYILQMPFISDDFAKKKLKECITRQPKDWQCLILKIENHDSL